MNTKFYSALSPVFLTPRALAPCASQHSGLFLIFLSGSLFGIFCYLFFRLKSRFLRDDPRDRRSVLGPSGQRFALPCVEGKLIMQRKQQRPQNRAFAC